MSGSKSNDGYPHKKRRLGHRHTQREDYVRIQGGDDQGETLPRRNQAKEKRCLEEIILANTLILGFCLQGCEKKKCLLFEPLSPWCVVMAALANKHI